MAIPDIFLQIVREKLTSESPASQSQVLQKETVEMNETPSSPIAPKSIETPFILQVRLSRLRESHRMTRLPLILKFLLLI
uniref:Uncharacterized protein n=1 Tax=Brassica campestris TaxID=3711 RepID=A0A3P5YWB0_BRACM|nr:unnamed protein product [Brassica rapa]